MADDMVKLQVTLERRRPDHRVLTVVNRPEVITSALQELIRDAEYGEHVTIAEVRCVGRRGGATLACGHWTYAVYPGQRVGQGARCQIDPDHGEQTITKCNVDEPDEIYFAEARG